MKQMNKKTLKKVHVWVRAVIQLLYFLFIPSAYTAAFNGVKYIFTQGMCVQIMTDLDDLRRDLNMFAHG